ncbi:VOC family protein [Sphingobacterium mizutaii]|uniref:VOC family protein n=1 Tax=Sphingobacterium mizutaii TaxID=1010 RepID=UPI0016265EC4|nr:VOC family protein [Sphingobacterium mizutaii]
MKLDPIVAVQDVQKSAVWYERLLNLHNSHGGENFAVLQDSSGETIICLHQWAEHHHPSMENPDLAHGNGLILYFKTKDYQGIYDTAKEMQIKMIEDLHRNMNSKKMEFSFYDLDGYYISITEDHNYEG